MSKRSSIGPEIFDKYCLLHPGARLQARDGHRDNHSGRVHRGHQLKSGRIGDVVICPADNSLAGFNGLAQGIEMRSVPFRQLIEKQDATMGEADLTRSGAATATHKSRY